MLQNAKVWSIIFKSHCGFFEGNSSGSPSSLLRWCSDSYSRCEWPTIWMCAIISMRWCWHWRVNWRNYRVKHVFSLSRVRTGSASWARVTIIVHSICGMSDLKLLLSFDWLFFYLFFFLGWVHMVSLHCYAAFGAWRSLAFTSIEIFWKVIFSCYSSYFHKLAMLLIIHVLWRQWKTDTHRHRLLPSAIGAFP